MIDLNLCDYNLQFSTSHPNPLCLDHFFPAVTKSRANVCLCIIIDVSLSSLYHNWLSLQRDMIPCSPNHQDCILYVLQNSLLPLAGPGISQQMIDMQEEPFP
jgi:hypothetical protein